MELKVKRPWSVWIAQIFFLYALLMWVLAFLLALRTTPSDPSIVGTLFFAVYSLIYLGLFVTAFWGMAERKPYGRWLGVVMLSLLLILTNVKNILFPSDSNVSMASIVVQILLSVLLFVVVAHISISEKADAFFIRKIAPARIESPPPPPTFDD